MDELVEALKELALMCLFVAILLSPMLFMWGVFVGF